MEITLRQQRMLIEALKFYADRRNWEGGVQSNLIARIASALTDRGHRAREALGKIGIHVYGGDDGRSES
jgi:hypothetical protein